MNPTTDVTDAVLGYDSTSLIVGTCLMMCSQREREMREREGLLHPLELTSIEITNGMYISPRKKTFVKSPTKVLEKADQDKVVKEYCRPAAGRLDFDASEVRPASVLKQTMIYLLTSVASLESNEWYEIYQFVFDRIRAVRQDMVVQAIGGQEAVKILEMAVRFHVYSSYRLRHHDISEFDAAINYHHMLECLKELLCLYKSIGAPCDRFRHEMEAIYLLHNLGNEESLCHYLNLEPSVRYNPLVRKCFLASLSALTGNYYAVIALVSTIHHPLCLCVAAQSLHNIRMSYLQILSHGYSSKNCQFPISHLTQILNLPSDDVTYDLCSSCNLIDWFSASECSISHSTQQYICFNKSLFKWPSNALVCPDVAGLDSLLQHSLLPSLFVPEWRDERNVLQERMNENNCSLNVTERDGETESKDRMTMKAVSTDKDRSTLGMSECRSGVNEVNKRINERINEGIDDICNKDREKVGIASKSCGRGRGKRVRKGGDNLVEKNVRGRGRGRAKKEEIIEEQNVSGNLERMVDSISFMSIGVGSERGKEGKEIKDGRTKETSFKIFEDGANEEREVGAVGSERIKNCDDDKDREKWSERTIQYGIEDGRKRLISENEDREKRELFKQKTEANESKEEVEDWFSNYDNDGEKCDKEVKNFA